MKTAVALVAALFGALVTSSAGAQPRTQDNAPRVRRTPGEGEFETSFRVGYALGRISHPKFRGSTASGVVIEVDFGYRLSPTWSIGFQLSGTEIPVNKVGKDTYVQGTENRAATDPEGEFLKGYADCSDCMDTLRGGVIFAESMRTLVTGPRVEFSPTSLVGGYMGLAGGLGSVTLEDTNLAGALSVRGGYRYQFGESACVGLGLGLTGIFIEQHRAWLPYAALELRLF